MPVRLDHCTLDERNAGGSMQKILVVEDAEPEMRLMVWLLTDDGSDVRVSSTIGEVIADIERFTPDTVVFNSRMHGQKKDACIRLIRELVPDTRIIDVSSRLPDRDKRLVDVSERDVDDPARDASEDSTLSSIGLIHIVNHRRASR
jgi:CheY-like chemotaxis protein